MHCSSRAPHTGPHRAFRETAAGVSFYVRNASSSSADKWYAHNTIGSTIISIDLHWINHFCGVYDELTRYWAKVRKGLYLQDWVFECRFWTTQKISSKQHFKVTRPIFELLKNYLPTNILKLYQISQKIYFKKKFGNKIIFFFLNNFSHSKSIF